MNPQIRAAGPTAIKLLTSHSSFSVLDALAPAFERASGQRVSAEAVELLAVPGVDLVGPLPDEIQKVFETSAAIFTASKQPQAADTLLRFLLAPTSAGVFREKGLEPVAGR